jgi:UDP-N-acetylglucosamine--N-acetylmuramyl-(pentapeptide) pyrophosphoryl-undecaprenol N-acetylglucosamine transferase
MTGHVLACASAGGHFKQLLRLVDRLPDCRSVTWLTYDSGLTHDLLAASGRSWDRVVLAPYAAPRDLVNLARDAVVARRLLREEDFDLAVSTGAGLAVATLPVARSTGVRSIFIESATRAEGPSMSGRILERVPGMELYTQNPGYSSRWGHVGSVHDEFVPGVPRSGGSLGRVVVTLGTIQPYQFRRLVARLVRLLPSSADVLWQTGATDVSGLAIDGRVTVPAPELEEAMREADLVVAHAGTGTALTAFELGRCPVLVPRRRAFDEHIDDHQVETARMLAGRGLASYAEVEDLAEELLHRAATRTVTRLERPPTLTL